MKTQRPITSEEEHRVLQFRPRNAARAPGRQGYPREQAEPEDARAEPNDLSRYERARDEPDDFRHRMLANVAAFAFTVALMAIGIWLAMSIADLRKTQDCVLMGRRDCVRISHAAYASVFGARPAPAAPGRSDRFGPPPASIELGAALRYTGTRLRMADRAFRDAAPPCLAIAEFILNISKA